MKTTFQFHGIYFLTIIFLSVSSPVPIPTANPQSHPVPYGLSRSSQQFTMYKPVEIGYTKGTLPTHPVFHYSHNVSHNSGRSLGPSQQFFPQRNLQQSIPFRQQLQRQQYTRQNQNNNYTPVIITNPSAITNPTLRPQNLLAGRGYYPTSTLTSSAQFHDSETEPENEGIGIGFRSNSRQGKANVNSGKIVFDQRYPNQQLINQALQYPEKIHFSGGANQRSGSGQVVQVPYGNSVTPTRPPIQVPYITTPSTLKQLMQLQKNSQQALAGFRSQLGLINPASLQSTSLAELGYGRNAALNPALRNARVQNIVVPVSSVAQTPAGTRLLQQNLQNQQGLRNLQNSVANAVYAHQSSSNFGNPFGLDLSSPNLHILKGLAITPENQRDVGHLIFTDPRNPVIPHRSSVIASNAQKVFVLPQGPSPTNSENANGLNFEDTPAEIIVTVVDEDFPETNSTTGEKGKVLSNFSLFLLPSSYRKCTEGYRRAHDGKCRLIIKLRGRSRIYG